MNRTVLFTAVVLLAVCGGCSDLTSFRVVDERTGQPLSGITAAHKRTEDLTDLFLLQPPGTRTVAVSQTDAGGRVAFRGVGASHRVEFSIRDGRVVTAFPADGGAWDLRYFYDHHFNDKTAAHSRRRRYCPAHYRALALTGVWRGRTSFRVPSMLQPPWTCSRRAGACSGGAVEHLSSALEHAPARAGACSNRGAGACSGRAGACSGRAGACSGRAGACSAGACSVALEHAPNASERAAAGEKGAGLGNFAGWLTRLRIVPKIGSIAARRRWRGSLVRVPLALNEGHMGSTDFLPHREAELVTWIYTFKRSLPARRRPTA